MTDDSHRSGTLEPGPEPDSELAAIAMAVAQIDRLSQHARIRVARYVFERYVGDVAEETLSANTNRSVDAAVRPAEASPKQFVAAKNPKTDIERVAVLGVWLASSGIAAFNGEDLATANMQAAGPKFNLVDAGKNAVKRGLLATAGDRRRQVTALGEKVVAALPDREAASAILQEHRPRRPAGRRRQQGRAPG